MTNSNKDKTDKPHKKSALDRFKLFYEKDKEKPAMSPTFGKQDIWIIRVIDTVHHWIVYFFYNAYIALKAIIKEIM